MIFINYYDEIKKELLNNEITKKVKNYSINKSDLTTYYNIGKLLSEAGKHYGEGIIKEYSKRLINEFRRNFGITLLKRIRQFYIVIEKGATMSHQLSWSHYCELLPVNSIDKINYYIKITEEQNLSVRELRTKIKNNDRLNFRMMELFESFLGKKVSDLSVNERSFFRKNAIKLFLHNPVMGIGINNFAAYMKKIGYSHVAYSHCNFTEILSNLGIFGFIIYYFIYFYIIKKAIILLPRKKNKTVLYYSLILIVILLIFEYGFVSYYLFEIQIQIFICYLLVNIEKIKGDDLNE